MNFHDEIRKMQERKITIHGKIDDSAIPAFQEMIRLAIEETQRQKQLQKALEESGIAHLDGYNPYLN